MSNFAAEREKRFSLIYTAGTFKNIFGWPLGIYRDSSGGFDILKFDRHIKDKYGDYEDGNTSLKDFIEKEFGDVSVELINYLLMSDYEADDA